MKIGIITAMSSERRQIERLLPEPKQYKIGPFVFTTGMIGANEIILMQCGIGKVNAASGTVELIHQFAPDCVISTGVAGGIDKSLHVMDVVASKQIVHHDVWCGEGNEIGQVQDLPLQTKDENKNDKFETPDTSIGSILTDLQKMKAEMENNTEELKKDETVSSDTVQINNQELKDKINELDNLNIPESFETMYEKTFGEIAPSKKEQIREEKKEFDAFDIIKEEDKISVFEEQENYNEGEEKKKSKPDYKFIGIVFRTYIIIEIKDEMYMIDQHAAHEKVLYEKIKKNYYSNSEKECQMLLLPDVITLTPKEMDIARDNLDIFKKAGFELEEFGENTIRLNGVPPMCYDMNTKDLLQQLHANQL